MNRVLSSLCLAAVSLSAQVFQTAIAPGKASPIAVTVLPDAACKLSGHGDSGISHSLTLYSDDQGHIRFHAQTTAESIAPANLSLQCQAGSQIKDYSIEITANAALAASSAPDIAAPPRSSSNIRPPLTGDPMAPTQPELLNRGYPMRPDPNQQPEAYATWLLMVTTPTPIISPKFVQEPNRFHAVANPNPGTNPVLPTTGFSGNWSGLVLYQDNRPGDPFPPAPYSMVWAEWYVPAVTGEPDIQDDSAFWTGMDGWGSKNVLQAGTEQQIFTLSIVGIQFTITNYYAWSEFYPLPESRVTDFPISPGDHIVAQVWQTFENGQPVQNGNCMIANLTHPGFLTFPILPPPGTIFSGNTAEWIMERPTVGGVWPDLSNYHAATMFNAFAVRSDLTTVNSSGNSLSLNLTMANANYVPLSQVTPTSNTSMSFQWLGFK